MIKISPSVLAADAARLAAEAEKMRLAGADMLHFDVMDGHFVPNISFGIPVLESLNRASGLFMDVHLMISEPARYAAAFAQAGADLLTFHLEAADSPASVIDLIHGLGVKAGISVKPSTPAEALFPYLKQADLVLVMTVEPGFGGQSFLPDMLPKITALRREAERQGAAPDIQVDGGINAETGKQCVAAGANVLVAGSYLFHADDPRAAMQRLRQLF